MKRLNFLLLAGFLTVILLTACQASTPVAPAASPSPIPVETTLPAGGASSYPAPESLVASPVPPSQIVGVYPGPVTGSTTYFDWQAAEAAILSGEVAQVYQDNFLHVTLVMKNGEIKVSSPPDVEAANQVLERCGDPCKETSLIRE